MSRKVAVVTGSNKGLGLAIVKGLLQSSFDGDVILTARNESRGQDAMGQLRAEGLEAKFHPLDITDHNSVITLRDFLHDNYQGLDILVNNAAIVFKSDSSAPFSEQAEVTCRNNFFAACDVCEVLFPLLRPHARVVTISSISSLHALRKCSPDLQNKFTDPEISMSELKRLMTDFVTSAQDNRHTDQGYPEFSYGMSKLGNTVMTIVQQRQLDQQAADDILVNCCCPGVLKTGLTSFKGERSPEEGAATPLYLCLLPANTTDPRGKFLQDKQVTAWVV